MTERRDGSAGLSGSADGAAARRTRAAAVAAVGGDGGEPAHPRQVHGARVLRAGTGASGPLGDGDGVWTTEARLPLLVLGADCCILALAARDGSAVAAVHAGWRGAVAGVPGAAVAAMARGAGVPPAALRAALGPGIGPCCYEVGPEVEAAFRAAHGPAASAWFRPGPRGRAHLDLGAAVKALLASAGVPGDAVAPPAGCTACEPERWFSHRRGDGGRQALVVARGP